MSSKINRTSQQDKTADREQPGNKVAKNDRKPAHTKAKMREQPPKSAKHPIEVA